MKLRHSKIQLRNIVILCCVGSFCWGCQKDPEVSEPAVVPVVLANIASQTEHVAHSPFRFEECASQLSIEHHYRDGAEHEFYSILESLGGGVAMLDYDRDGRMDCFVTGGGDFTETKVPVGRNSTLFRQSPLASALPTVPTYVVVSDVSGSSHSAYYSHGGAVTDYNNDGFDDVLVTGYGGVQLFQNLGDGTFVEYAADAHLTDPLWSSSAAWGDFNGDGANDVYITHYADWSPENDPPCYSHGDTVRDVCPPRSFSGLVDTLYLSDGAGKFIDATDRLIGKLPGKGLGVATADIDLDGDTDIYVTNDNMMNYLLINEANEKFTECGASSATGFGDTGGEDGSMGVDIGDYNGDCLPDIWVTNYENESFALYRSFDGHFFQHVSRSTGISAAGGLSVGWGTQFGDLDLDGDEDLFVANGHVIRHPINSPLNQRPLLLVNDEQKRFREVAKESGDYLATEHMSRGVAQGDLDDDGDLDFIISNINQPLAILRNESIRLGNWIELQLIGVQSSRWAEGAWVELEPGDGRKVLRLKKGGTSYASTSDRRIHVGVGKCERIGKLTIHWPLGGVQTLTDVATNQQLQIVESIGYWPHE